VDSGGILEFRSIPADSAGICGGMKSIANMLKMESNIFGLSNMLFSHRHKGSFPGPAPALYQKQMFATKHGRTQKKFKMA
jgi:hypothetical protein